MADTENTAAPKKEGRPVITRRALCAGLGGTAALLGLGAVRYAGSAPLVRPPGGQDEEALVSACIRCEKCYEVCPRGVIAPAHLEDGILNMRTPSMDFKAGWCDFCTHEDAGPQCVNVCPTQALVLPAGAVLGNTETGEVGNVVLGVAEVNRDWCLPAVKPPLTYSRTSPRC